MVWLLLIANCYALGVVARRGVRFPALAWWLVFGVFSCMVYNPWSPWRFIVMALIGFGLRMWLSIECVRLILPKSHAELMSLLLASGCIGALLFLSVAYIIEREYNPGVMLTIYLWVGSLGWFWTMIGVAWRYSPVPQDGRFTFVLVVGLEFLVVALARLSSGDWAVWQSCTIAARTLLICWLGNLAKSLYSPHYRKHSEYADNL